MKLEDGWDLYEQLGLGGKEVRLGRTVDSKVYTMDSEKEKDYPGLTLLLIYLCISVVL